MNISYRAQFEKTRKQVLRALLNASGPYCRYVCTKEISDMIETDNHETIEPGDIPMILNPLVKEKYLKVDYPLDHSGSLMDTCYSPIKSQVPILTDLLAHPDKWEREFRYLKPDKFIVTDVKRD